MQQSVRFVRAAATAAALGAAGAASAQALVQSATSSQSPYVVPVAGGPAVHVVSFLTVGDAAGPGGSYVMAGIPDGIGAYDNGDGTMTLLVNHEFGATTAAGFVRAHQVGTGTSGGSFVSRWIVSSVPGPDFLRAQSGSDFMNSVVCTTNGTGGSKWTFSRFCSADLAAPSAFYNAATGKGSTEQIFLTGEENGAPGRVLGIGVSERVGYELLPFGVLQGGWENALARPYASDETVVMANSDGAANRVYLYRGTKTTTGTTVERAGLTNGTGYGVQVVLNGNNVAAESRDFGFATSGAPVLSARFTFVPGNAGTSFLRPEDGAWDPTDPRTYYFVTTDRLDTTEGGGSQIGRSRLWRMRFDDANDVLAGGTIDALLDGTEGQNMLDNMCAFADRLGQTRMLLQEDSGNAAHNAKTWLYTVATDSLRVALKSDPARFGDIGVAGTSPFNQDEENSGVIDASSVLGRGWFIGCTQAHYSLAAPLIEGGQLYAFFLPAADASCMADVAQPADGVVDGADLGALLGNWGQPGRSDLNLDGTTDGADLGLLLGAWGACAP